MKKMHEESLEAIEANAFVILLTLAPTYCP